MPPLLLRVVLGRLAAGVPALEPTCGAASLASERCIKFLDEPRFDDGVEFRSSLPSTWLQGSRSSLWLAEPGSDGLGTVSSVARSSLRVSCTGSDGGWAMPSASASGEMDNGVVGTTVVAERRD
jgi:hypothetical protein